MEHYNMEVMEGEAVKDLLELKKTIEGKDFVSLAMIKLSRFPIKFSTPIYNGDDLRKFKVNDLRMVFEIKNDTIIIYAAGKCKIHFRRYERFRQPS